MATASDVPVASKVKESVKETLLGSEEPVLLSAHTQATFLKHAHHDEKAGELVMTETEFVDAIAPEKEDYVSLVAPWIRVAGASIGTGLTMSANLA